VLADRFAPGDSALRMIAEVLHDIDQKEDRFARPETPRVAGVILGIAASEADDDARIAAGESVLHGLYAHFSRGKEEWK
jgi:hypothetical protein